MAWACFSMPLLVSDQLATAAEPVANCPLRLTPTRAAWLQRLDRDATGLLRHLQRSPSRRLGLYFEQLWHFFLDQDPHVDLLAHNLPVRTQDGRTLGEFDCIYYCHRRKRAVHLELAVKFYLGLGGSTADRDHSEQQEWHGANSTDRLDLKINHLMQHQVLLSQNPASKDVLEGLGIEDPLPELEIKGYLFQPRIDPLPPPLGYTPDKPFSHWLPIINLGDWLERGPCTAFRVLERTHWLAPVQVDSIVGLLGKRELNLLLTENFTRTYRPVLVAGMNDQGSEVQRFFVTGDNWPENPGK